MNSLITMSGPYDLDVHSLTDFEAGIAFLMTIGRAYPGARFSDLPRFANRPEAMGRRTFLERKLSQGSKAVGNTFKAVGNAIVSATGNVKDGIADVLGDTLSFTGDAAGSAVRLITDPTVLDGASKIAAAYATNGGSVGLSESLKGLTGGSDSAGFNLLDFISSLGGKAKAATAPGDDMTAAFDRYAPWVAGGVGGLVLLSILMKPGAKNG